MNHAAIFGRFCELLADPAAGAALYDAYSADAPLLIRQAVRPKAEIDRAEFAALIAAQARVLGGRPGPALDGPELVSVAGNLAWFRAYELVDGRALWVAVGFRNDGIHWVTLAERQEAWDYEVATAQAVADFAYAEAIGLQAPRGWLDLAYHRLYRLPRPALATLPGARFGCQGSTMCCKIGFEVSLPAGAQAVVDALPWERIAPELAGTQLAPRPDGRLQLRGAHEDCRFLDDNNRCVLHSALGRAPFPVCAAYPFVFTATPDGVAVTAHGTCPSARVGLGPALTERTEDLYGRMAMAPLAPPPTAFFLAPGHEVSWQTFREVEEILLELLADPSRPLIESLYEGERVMHEALGLPSLPPQRPVAPPLERLATRAFLVAHDHRLEIAPGTPHEISADLRLRELAEVARGLIHEKGYSFGADLLTAWHVAVWLSMLGARCQADGVLTPELTWRIAAAFGHQAVFRSLAGGPGAARELMEALGRPDFGPRLLAAAVQGRGEALPVRWELVRSADLPSLREFLARDEVGNLSFLDGLAEVEAHGLEAAGLGWYGLREGERWLALTTSRRCLSFYAPEGVEALAAFYAQRLAATPWLQGDAEVVARLLESLPGDRTQDVTHQIMELKALPDSPPDPAVRLATMDDLPYVAAYDAAMVYEESGIDPSEEDPRGFQATIARRIQDRRVYVLEEDGQIRFQLALGFAIPGLAEVINTYTPPNERRKGYGKRGMLAACRDALQRYPRLVLMTKVGQAHVVGMYEAVGFRDTAQRVREVVWT